MPSVARMSSIRCKFVCTSVTKSKGWGDHEFLYAARFEAVQGGSDENKSFFAATPCGSVEVSTVASDKFEVGKEYFLDFTPAE